ncbi:hypothetical protein EPO15_01680 [bacterium]|nr:MAG: hypothetical protein EPO15_01680 [bacterium]
MRQWVVVALALAALGSPVRAEVALDQAGVQDRMMVVFDKSVPAADKAALAAKHGLEVIRDWAPLNALVVRPQAGKSLPSVAALKSEFGVLAVGHDEWRYWLDAEAASLRQVPLPSVGAVLKRLPKLGDKVGKAEEVQWGVRRVNAPAAWARGNMGRGVKVGVVDTGIDPTHPEFSGRIVGGTNAIDSKQPWADDHSHGTHVAGIIAAALDNNGTVGVAPAANLYAIKVLTKDGQGSLFAILGGIMWCVQNGMEVVNMSLGAPQGNQLFEMAVNQLASADIPLIAAAGNDGKAVNFPAAYESAIAVSALCPEGGDENPKLCNGSAIAAFSSRGPEVDFIAPGVKNLSTVLGGQYKAYSGTSMATPHVTGLAALAIAGGAKGSAAVRAALQRAAVPVAGLNASEQGAGLIDADRLR